jgi:ribosomal protein L37E
MSKIIDNEVITYRKEIKCFRCGKPINNELFVKTLSNEYSHIYCQAPGRKPLHDKVKEKRE